MLPITQKTALQTKLDSIETINRDCAKHVNNLARRTLDAFDEMWGGSKADKLISAQAVNAMAVNAGTTALDIFNQHAAVALFCITSNPELIGKFKPSPIDIEAVVDGDGMIDLELFAIAVDGIPVIEEAATE